MSVSVSVFMMSVHIILATVIIENLVKGMNL
jgi:hypothetical protein